MSVVTRSMFIIIFTVEFIIGNVGNGFIVVLYCMDWAKRRKISLADKILTGLAVSRIVFIWITIVSVVLLILPLGVLNFVDLFSSFFLLPWTVATHFSIWLATCLSIFYFLKIANFSNSTFLYLKQRIKKVVSVTLLISLVPLFANIMLLSMYSITWIDDYKGNASFNSKFKSDGQPFKLMINFFIFCFLIPFKVSLIAFLLLIFSLWKHLKKMQHNAKGSRDASTLAHIRALQSIITFLLLYTVFFMSQVAQVWSSNLRGNILFILFCQAVGMVFPSVHSCVLILGNTKLWQTFLSILWWLTPRPKDVTSSGL